MKKFLPIVLVAVLFAACNKPAGELVGIGSHANFSEANPYGMVYVKQGANKQFAILMTLTPPPQAKMTVWCTDNYEPNYGFGASGWSSFNPSGEASSLCQGISGNRNGLMFEK